MDPENNQENTEISIQDYADWIKKKRDNRYQVSEESDGSLLIETEAGKMEIRFYDPGIAEISIYRKKDGKLRYYLHFELKSKKHAEEMFQDMEDALNSLRNEKTLQVLLSCTSGATTSFLAGKLNQYCEESDIDWHFWAVPYIQLEENADRADLILIAPQIAYMKDRFQQALPDKQIVQIPTTIFGAFNTAGTVDFIQELLHEEARNEHRAAETFLHREQRASRFIPKAPILAISIIMDYEQFNATFRYYDKGILVDEERAVFAGMKRKYLWQQISYMLRKNRKADWIVLALPGVVSDEQVVSMKKMNMDHFNLAAEIEKRYHTRCFVVNNVNACALGCYQLHTEIHNLSLISLPYGATAPGVGSIVDGKLISGRRGLAGESKFYLYRMQLSNTAEKLCRTEAGHYELLINTILPIIALLDPDMIYLRTPLIRNMKELTARLSAFLSEEYIPKLIYTENPIEEIFAGLGTLIEQKESEEKQKSNM